MPPAWQAKRQQRAGFHRLQGAHVFFAELNRRAVLHEAAFGGEIEHLAAGHAADAGGARQRHDQLDAHARIGVGLPPRQNVEREGEQAVAGEDRGRLVERLCAVGWPRRTSSLSMAGRSSCTKE